MIFRTAKHVTISDQIRAVLTSLALIACCVAGGLWQGLRKLAGHDDSALRATHERAARALADEFDELTSSIIGGSHTDCRPFLQQLRERASAQALHDLPADLAYSIRRRVADLGDLEADADRDEAEKLQAVTAAIIGVRDNARAWLRVYGRVG